MDSRKMKQIFQEIEAMTGNKLGSYLRHGGRNSQQINRIFEDEFTCSQLEKLDGLITDYMNINTQTIEQMNPEFLDQYNQIVAIQKAISATVDELNYTISNLPEMMESIAQMQIESIFQCYKKNHAIDYPNMNQSLKLLREQGFQDTPDNRIKFVATYLKSYFRKVVATSIQTGSYKKYKVAVINRFQERYEEMLAG